MTSLPTATSPVQQADGDAARTDRVVVGGIDTHKDLHVAAVLDGRENVLGTRSFSTTRAGYRALLRWMFEFGSLSKVGIEGTGSFGAARVRRSAAILIRSPAISRMRFFSLALRFCQPAPPSLSSTTPSASSEP